MKLKTVICVSVFWVTLCVFGLEAYAQTMYVADSFEITLRTGPGADRKIISLVRSGSRLEVITPGSEWTEVRLENGKQGWVLTRYITDKTPKALALASLQGKYQKLLEKNAAVKQQLQKLREDKQSLEQQLKTTANDLARLENKYNTLKKEAADFLALKARYQKTAAELQKVKEDTAMIREENSRMKRNHNIKWFLSGAGVLFAGWILGISGRRSRRRSSLL